MNSEKKQSSVPSRSTARHSGREGQGSSRALTIIFTVIIIILIAIVVYMAFRTIANGRRAENAASAQEAGTKNQGIETGEEASALGGSSAQGAPQDGAAEKKDTDGTDANKTPPSKNGDKGSAPDASAAHSAAPRADDNSPLMLGNPTGATSDAANKDNYLLVKSGYVLSYNADLLTANWVAWHLDKTDLGDAVRSNDFRVDDTLGDEFFQVKSSDYQFNTYGFDRGHLCPSADRTANAEKNSETFLMTNMVPQSPDNNRIVWKALESYERDEAAAGNELYIFAGVQGKGGESAKGEFSEITIKDGLSIAVPAYTWKIMLILSDGDGDLERINKDTTVIAVMVPNRQGLKKKGVKTNDLWKEHTASIDAIEDATSWDFFDVLEDDIEDVLEAKVVNSE